MSLIIVNVLLKSLHQGCYEILTYNVFINLVPLIFHPFSLYMYLRLSPSWFPLLKDACRVRWAVKILAVKMLLPARPKDVWINLAIVAETIKLFVGGKEKGVVSTFQ